MILGTWNLETYAPPRSTRSQAQRGVLEHLGADVWFLTELHCDWYLDDHNMLYSVARPEAPESHRKAAIATRWSMEPIINADQPHPFDGRLSMARISPPGTSQSLLAVCTVLPWRGATPLWKQHLGAHLSYAEIYVGLLHYVVTRIEAERKAAEPVLWGGDFNQGLHGRDYVGTLQGREATMRAFAQLGLQVPTQFLAASIVAHPAIDHLAVPATWRIDAVPEIHRPRHGEKPLSDHALYRVSVEPE